LVAKLVKQFRTNLAAYHAPAYKEAHARQDLIDPLFIALGWDVHNEERAAPQYRQVILEDSLEVEGEETAKRPITLSVSARHASSLPRLKSRAWRSRPLPARLINCAATPGAPSCRFRSSRL